MIHGRAVFLLQLTKIAQAAFNLFQALRIRIDLRSVLAKVIDAFINQSFSLFQSFKFGCDLRINISKFAAFFYDGIDSGHCRVVVRVKSTLCLVYERTNARSVLLLLHFSFKCKIFAR
ncbi:hypothetical protein D3C72_1658280 [compost metagenome]